jgi:hypothetical protein
MHLLGTIGRGDKQATLCVQRVACCIGLKRLKCQKPVWAWFGLGSVVESGKKMW